MPQSRVSDPLTKTREPNLKYVIDSIESLLPYLQPGQMPALQSTTYAGPADEQICAHPETKDLFPEGCPH